MNFSKKTLFAAALLAGTALVASADIKVNGDVELSKVGNENLVVDGNSTINLGGQTVTLSGSLLSGNGSLASQELTDWTGDKNSDQNTSVTITGGGSFTYAGSAGSAYYTDSYQTSRGETNFDPGGNVWNAWVGMDSFWSAGNFTGKLIVDGGVKFLAEAQLSQYVGFVRPTAITADKNWEAGFSGYAGIQAIELKDGATLSFEASAKNMVNSRPNLGNLDPQSGYNPKPVLSLNFVNNLTADANSRVIIGTDEASANRIVFNAGEAVKSTVGRLSGNGRLYTTGAGEISFIGVSELNPGTNVNADGTADTTGNTWQAGNRLADVILGTATVNVGGTGTGTVVDNVFANATAVHIAGKADSETFGQNLSTDGIATAAANNTKINAGAYYVGEFYAPTVNVYGDQVFNNFQSLWVDRSALLATADIDGPSAQVYEPVSFGGRQSLGRNSEVILRKGAVLTINQSLGRDGIYAGDIISKDLEVGEETIDADGLVVKTGKGRIVYRGSDTISNLRIEEGEWIFLEAFSSDIVLAKEGQLTVRVGTPETADFSIRAIDSTSVLLFAANYLVENDLTPESLESVKSGETSDVEYRRLRFSAYGGSDNIRDIQITKQQTLFYGKVLVKDGATLTLGGDSSSESVFSSAASIELSGDGTEDASQWAASTLAITGTQLVRNLKGDAGTSAVTIADGATLVLTNTDSSITYAGGFAGQGNFVKLGKSLQRITGNAKGELTGTVAVLSGSVSLDQKTSNAGVSGLILKSDTSASFGGDAKAGALIGEVSSSVSLGGTLTVGGTGTPNGPSDGSYFATANYDAYKNYFTGTEIESVLTNLSDRAEKMRQYQPASGTFTELTTENTLSYLKNPAGLVYKTSDTKLDGAFTMLFTSTGTDRNGADVFAKMKEGTNGSTVFGTSANVAAWLRSTFTKTDVDAFVSKAGSQLSESQKVELSALAEEISGRESGVLAYLDGNGNINTSGWNKIVAAGGLEYLKSKFGTSLSAMKDESLYSFITAFYKDYEFVLTPSVAAQIEQIYGVSGASWFSGNKADYNAFVASFGVASSEFAGTLSGSGALVKTGAETLTLTGQNSYTGITKIEAGELRVDWNAIQRSSGIIAEQGALLTISGTDSEIYESYKDPETGVDTGYKTNNGYGFLFSGSRATNARLTGSGTVLKLGDGKVNLGNALLDTKDGDFTGNFLVANGSLKATVNAVARAEAQSPLAFNIYFNKETTGTVAEPTFELAFAHTEGFDYVVGTQATELEFTGTIKGSNGAGKFILDAGVTRPSKEVASVNNVLKVSADKFSVNSVDVKSGTLDIAVASGTNAAVFKTATLSENAELRFDLSADYALADAMVTVVKTDATVGGKGGKLTVATGEISDATYANYALTLTNGSLTGVSSLALVGGAKLALAGTPANAQTDVVLTSITADAQTSLDIAADRTVELTGSGTLAGTLTGSGKFIFNGDKDSVLTLGNTEDVSGAAAFGGTIEFKNGTIALLAGANDKVTYDGLSLTAELSAERTLVKDGAGTVEILRDTNGTNAISVSDLAIDVKAGKLAVSGDMFSENNGKLPASINIENGATFSFCEAFAGTSFDLGNLKELSGSGTLAFDLTGTTDITVSAFNAQKFSGVVSVSSGTTLKLGANVTEFAAFSGEGNVNVEASDLTVRVDGNADGANVFNGNLTGNLTSLTVLGDGAMVFGDGKVPTSVTEINVGSATENGGAGVASGWTGTLNAQGATSSILIIGKDNFAGTTNVADSVENLNLATEGEIALGEKAVATKFGLDKSGVALDGNVNVTLANIANTELRLTNLENLGAESFGLHANAGEIVFDGSQSTSFAYLRADASASATAQAEWTKDISGTGAVRFENGANVKLSAGTLSYTGATTVAGNSTLEYAPGTVSQSSSLTVESGSTLIGGVDLVAAGSDVIFEGGSLFRFTGDAVRFTGTAEVQRFAGSSKIDVILDEDALNARGVPVALFELIGTDGQNKITWDNLDIAASDTLGYYKDTTSANPDKLVIYVTADNLAAIEGVTLHEGLDAQAIADLSTIATPENGKLKSYLYDADGNLTTAGQLAEAIIKTPNSSLAGTLNNLSPLSYGAMLALPQSGFVSDISAISARIEQRRYDSYTQFAWEIHDDWEFFAQAQGAFAESDEGASDTRTFDMNTYGAIAGMDVKMDAATVAGFSFAYDFGNADIHNGGGEIQSHDIRATAFIGKLFADRFYLDAGAQAGFTMFDVDRNTALGNVSGDTTGWHVGAFANVGMLIPLDMSEDEKTSVNLMPYFGLAYSYYGISAFEEDGAATALDTDSFGASSLRATVGASLAVTFPWLGKTSRFNLDFSYTRELMDSEVDIDYAMPGIEGAGSYTASAKAFTEDTFSIGPRLSYDLDRNNSIYAGYRFDFSTDSDTAHSVNLGFRSRF